MKGQRQLSNGLRSSFELHQILPSNKNATGPGKGIKAIHWTLFGECARTALSHPERSKSIPSGHIWEFRRADDSLRRRFWARNLPSINESENRDILIMTPSLVFTLQIQTFAWRGNARISPFVGRPFVRACELRAPSALHFMRNGAATVADSADARAAHRGPATPPAQNVSRMHAFDRGDILKKGGVPSVRTAGGGTVTAAFIGFDADSHRLNNLDFYG